MATYPPPNFIEPITVFNTSNWISSGETIDEAFLNANYLKYPVAQGTETLQAINVNGISTFNNNIDAIGSLNRFGDYDNISGGTFLTINDNTQTIIGNAAASLGLKSIGLMSFGDLIGQGNATVISTDDPNLTITINSGGLTRIGDVNTNNGKIVIDATNQTMTLTAASQLTLSTFAEIDLVGPNVKLGNNNPSFFMELDANNSSINLTTTNGTITLDTGVSGDVDIGSGNQVRIGDYNASANNQFIQVSNTNKSIEFTATNGVKVLKSSIQYPSTFNNTSQTLGVTSSYAQTFNGTSLIATLPSVLAGNVGTQFLITNTNAGSMTVNSTGGQIIYSATSPSTATSRSLNTGHSQIFTAIRTTATNVYGWSMV